MDHIWLKEIECRVRLGVPDSERRKPQRILVDVGLELDLRSAGQSDDFRATVDYWGVEKWVREVSQRGEFRLAEHLAETLAHAALTGDPRFRSVVVRVHKKPAVMPRTREVIVEVRRARGQYSGKPLKKKK